MTIVIRAGVPRHFRASSKAKRAHLRRSMAFGPRNGIFLWKRSCVLAKYTRVLAKYTAGLAEYPCGLAKYTPGLGEYPRRPAEYTAGLPNYPVGLANYTWVLAKHRAGPGNYTAVRANYMIGCGAYTRESQLHSSRAKSRQQLPPPGHRRCAESLGGKSNVSWKGSYLWIPALPPFVTRLGDLF